MPNILNGPSTYIVARQRMGFYQLVVDYCGTVLYAGSATVNANGRSLEASAPFSFKSGLVSCIEGRNEGTLGLHCTALHNICNR